MDMPFVPYAVASAVSLTGTAIEWLEAHIGPLSTLIHGLSPFPEVRSIGLATAHGNKGSVTKRAGRKTKIFTEC